MIFFDIDQTLLDFKGSEKAAVEAIYEGIFEQSHITKHDFYQSWQVIGEAHFKKYLLSECTFEQQRINRVKELHQNIFNECISDQQANHIFERYLEYFENYWVAFDDVVPCLESLSEYRLGIISNGDENQQIKKLKKIGIADYFEVIITSGRVGKAKPDPYIFQYACSEAGVKPNECIYVGDNLKVDIWGCRSSYMKGIWINRNNFSDEGSKVISISNLEELIDHL